MRAKEFITEHRVALSVDIARALPGTYTIPGLPNSDFYKQYRFGVALAGARGQMEREQDSIPPYDFEKETPWGENMIVSAYMDGYIEQDIDYAKIGNFKYIIDTTLDNDYDLYIVNTSEAIAAISEYKKNVFLYTHLFNQIYPEQSGKSVFTDEFVSYFNSFLYKDYTVGTQSVLNRKHLMEQGMN